MSFDDYDILKELEKEESRAEHKELNEKREAMGYSQVEKERKAHKESLRKRLYRYYLNDNEIDELFKILTKYEEKMDKLKDKFDIKKAKHGDAENMQNQLVSIQGDMKKEFEKELAKTIKKKIEYAKKIAAQKNKN